jgi:hypothetical protein
MKPDTPRNNLLRTPVVVAAADLAVLKLKGQVFDVDGRLYLQVDEGLRPISIQKTRVVPRSPTH